MARDTLKDALTNPKRINDKRESDAEGDDGKKGRDAGNLPSPDGFQMSQSDFSGYPKDGKKSGPPTEMLKKRDKN
jgi:hypothetical protein